jgi:hypothetical protein
MERARLRASSRAVQDEEALFFSLLLSRCLSLSLSFSASFSLARALSLSLSVPPPAPTIRTRATTTETRRPVICPSHPSTNDYAQFVSGNNLKGVKHFHLKAKVLGGSQTVLSCFRFKLFPTPQAMNHEPLKPCKPENRNPKPFIPELKPPTLNS